MDPTSTSTSQIPDTPAAATSDPVATSGGDAATIAQLRAELAQTQTQLADAQAAAQASVRVPVQVLPSTSDASPATSATTDPDPGPADPAHALAPGSAGDAVKELATLVEQLGEGTYLSRGENTEHVFYDDLLAAVKRILSRHTRATAAIDEVEMKLRDVALLGEVTGEVWRTLRQLAAQAHPATTAGKA